MKVVYSPRATRDIHQIAAYYRSVADPRIARAIGVRIERVITRLAKNPLSAPAVTERPEVRMALVLRYPYKIFYRISRDAIEILHIPAHGAAPMGRSLGLGQLRDQSCLRVLLSGMRQAWRKIGNPRGSTPETNVAQS